MTKRVARALNTYLLCLASMVLVIASGSAAGRQDRPPDAGNQAASDPQEPKELLGRPETIAGTILMVKLEEGIVVLTIRGGAEPASTRLVGIQRVYRSADTEVRDGVRIDARPVPGQTDYSLKVTSSTQIRIGGQQAALSDLAGFENRQATARLVPRRSGDYALEIEVNR